MDTTKFQRAQEFFGMLEECAKGSLYQTDRVRPLDAEDHFATAAYAAAVLYSLGREQLIDLEKREIVHPSTISGGSLGTAMRAANDYLIGKEGILASASIDSYEQLARTCYSAKRFLDLVEGNYTPAF